MAVWHARDSPHIHTHIHVHTSDLSTSEFLFTGYETEADRPKKPARRDRGKWQSQTDSDKLTVSISLFLITEIEDVVNQIPNTHIPSCQKLLRVAKEMVTWEPEAHLLGLTEPERETILKDHYGDHEEQKYKMLEKWWRKEGREATWRTLASALSKHQEHLVNLIVKLAGNTYCAIYFSKYNTKNLTIFCGLFVLQLTRAVNPSPPANYHVSLLVQNIYVLCTRAIQVNIMLLLHCSSAAFMLSFEWGRSTKWYARKQWCARR